MEKLLKCPFCETVMKKIEKHSIIVDRCPNCLGIWLDKGEMDKIIERRKKRYPEEFKEKRDWGQPEPGNRPPTENHDINELIGEWE